MSTDAAILLMLHIVVLIVFAIVIYSIFFIKKSTTFQAERTNACSIFIHFDSIIIPFFVRIKNGGSKGD